MSPRGRHRQGAAIDHQPLQLFWRQRFQAFGEPPALVGIVALDVDQEALVGEGAEHLVERGQQADAGAAQRKGLAAVGGVAMADVELLQLGEAAFARDAVAVGAAVQGPVMEDGELAVGGRVNVEFDDVGAGGEGGAHRGQGVFDEGMLGRKNPRRGAGRRRQARRGIGLGQPAMREQGAFRLRRNPERAVAERDYAGNEEDEKQSKPNDPPHGAPGELRADHAGSLGRKHGASQLVIACDKREAFALGALATKQSSFSSKGKLDCFAALAMTLRELCGLS